MIERKLDGELFIRRKASPDTKRKVVNWEVWECNDKGYDHDYDRKVTFYVEQGKALLQFKTGEEVDVQKGDTLTIKVGASIHWVIKSPIRNLYCYHDTFNSANQRHEQIHSKRRTK